MNRDASAFPISVEVGINEFFPCNGLTKRELFAAMAMQGQLASSNSRASQEAWNNSAMCAEWAVEQADALLKALDK